LSKGTKPAVHSNDPNVNDSKCFYCSYGEIVKDSFHVFYPEDGDRENMKIDKLTKTIVNFLDPNIGQMVKVSSIWFRSGVGAAQCVRVASQTCSLCRTL
jgi:hypothetical protein